jgi:hypothetical protein
VLKTTKSSTTPSVQSLLKIWANRYTLDLLPLYSVADQTSAYAALAIAASKKGRTLTTAKLSDRFLTVRCQMAGIKSYGLYAPQSDGLELNETYQLSRQGCLIYKKLLEIYQELPYYTDSLVEIPIDFAPKNNFFHSSLASWGMPSIDELAKTLEPVLLEFQKHHIDAKDWRTLGFITTLLNFSNEFIAKKLTLPEQILLKPYFQFVEEQVSLPWERVCAAAANHKLGSPTIALVEQMLPQSREIAQAVYQRLMRLLPEHQSRRGGLDDPGITHSCLRDLEMFQAYLWLCLLEGSMTAIKDELVGLCVMVMTGVKVKWEMTELWNKVLAEELLARISPDQALILLPYTEALQQTFLQQKQHFQIKPDKIKLPAEVQKCFEVRGARSFFFPKQPISIVE